MVDDILDLAEVEADRAGFAMEPVPVAGILNDARNIISDRAYATGVAISCNAAAC